jgi:hypothetical protein
MGARSAKAAALLILAVAPPAHVSAQEPARPSSKLFADLIADAQKPKPTSPASDFGKAAAACAAALGPTTMEVAKLEPLGWSPTVKADQTKSTWMFEQKPSLVRIFLSTMFAPTGQCVVDGYGQSKGEFGAIASNVKKHVGAALGKKLKSAGSSQSPNGYSRGQGFLADKLMVSISSENRTNGMSIRVTLMQIDTTKSAFEIAKAAGMAAQYLPMMADVPDTPAKAIPTSTNPFQ